MPAPLSSTAIRRTPPACKRTVICVAPASSALSSSSRTTAAGRSMTSPAAIWLINSSGKSAMAREEEGLLACMAEADMTPYPINEVPPFQAAQAKKPK